MMFLSKVVATMTNKQIEICLGDYSFIADLIETKSPKTCKAILQNLPMNSEVTHATWSGDVLYVSFPLDFPFRFPLVVELENPTIYGSRGDVLFHPGPVELGLLMVYGYAQLRSRRGPLRCNLFARIKQNLDKLEEVGKKVQKEGAKKISVTKK